MSKLIFLIIVFIISILLSFYFSAEGFVVSGDTSDIATPLQRINQTPIDPICPTNSTIVGNVCYDQSNKIVEPNCPTDGYKKSIPATSSSPATWRCFPACPSGSTRLADGFCYNNCPTGKTFRNNMCVPNGSLDRVFVAAACVSPAVPDAYSNCISPTPGVAPVPKSCPSGTTLINNRCYDACPSGTSPNSDGSLCLLNPEGSSDRPIIGPPISGSCTTGTLIQGNCYGPCPSGKSPNTDGRLCLPTSVPPPTPSSAPPPQVSDHSGNRFTDHSGNRFTDQSGNQFNVRVRDLMSILSGYQPSINPDDSYYRSSDSQSQPLDNTDNSTLLSQFYDMLKPQIKNDISASIHKEFERSTVLPQGSVGQELSSCAQQGLAWQDTSCGYN